ncbi:hypothetical protein EDB19DRAFT_591321 [Suillus lakei]|nr:hypothetical protein EDB19DRAFT_591321 [Suillus lakei]
MKFASGDDVQRQPFTLPSFLSFTQRAECLRSSAHFLLRTPGSPSWFLSHTHPPEPLGFLGSLCCFACQAVWSGLHVLLTVHSQIFSFGLIVLISFVAYTAVLVYPVVCPHPKHAGATRTCAFSLACRISPHS